MNKKQKIILISSAVVLLLIIVLVFFFFLNKKEETNLGKGSNFTETSNDNENVIKEQTIDGLKISNVMLVVKKDGSTFSADVTNTTNEEIKGKKFNIIFKTSTDKKVTDMLGYFGKTIKPGETKQMVTSISRQLNKNIIKSVEYQLQ